MKFSIHQLTAACAIALLSNSAHALTSSVAPGGDFGTLTATAIDFYGFPGANTYTFNLAQKSTIYGDINPIASFVLTSLDINSMPVSVAANGLFSVPFLSAGNYTLSIIGTGGIAYGGTISATASAVAVPEANSIALALAGLGVTGVFLARRKKT